MLNISLLLKQCLTLKVFACLECLMKLFLNHFTFSHAKALLIYCWISIFHCGLVAKLDQDSWKLSNLWLKFERIGCLWSEWTNQMRLHKDASKEKGIMVLAYAVFIIYGGNKARRNLHITGTTTWKKKMKKWKRDWYGQTRIFGSLLFLKFIDPNWESFDFQGWNLYYYIGSNSHVIQIKNVFVTGEYDSNMGLF